MNDSPFRLLELFGFMFSFIGGIICIYGIIISVLTLNTFSVLLFGLSCILIGKLGSWIDDKLHFNTTKLIKEEDKQ